MEEQVHRSRVDGNIEKLHTHKKKTSVKRMLGATLSTKQPKLSSILF